ncbi:Transposase DDE domain-containing protein, partial [Micromonospora halophytica]
LQAEAAVVAEHPGILLISDKGFASKAFERNLAEQGIELLRPSRKKEKTRYGEATLKKVRQLIESVNDTLKGQLDLEEHGGRTFAGVAVRVAQRLLAMAAAIWHNNKTNAPVTRSLIAYDQGPDFGTTRLASTRPSEVERDDGKGEPARARRWPTPSWGWW